MHVLMEPSHSSPSTKCLTPMLIVNYCSRFHPVCALHHCKCGGFDEKLESGVWSNEVSTRKKLKSK